MPLPSLNSKTLIEAIDLIVLEPSEQANPLDFLAGMADLAIKFQHIGPNGERLQHVGDIKVRVRVIDTENDTMTVLVNGNSMPGVSLNGRHLTLHYSDGGEDMEHMIIIEIEGILYDTQLATSAGDWVDVSTDADVLEKTA